VVHHPNFTTPPATVRQTLPVSFTATGLVPIPTIAFDTPSTFTLASDTSSSTQNRRFQNRGALPSTGIAVGDFTVKVGAQPPGGGVSVSIAPSSTTKRYGIIVTSIGADATCNVEISIARPIATIGTTTPKPSLPSCGRWRATAASLPPLPFRPSVGAAVDAVLLGLVAALPSALLPAWRAASLDPVAAFQR